MRNVRGDNTIGLGEKFCQVDKLNKNTFAKTVDMARGNISVEVFAADCGISPATVFRIIAGKRKRPASYDIIKRLSDGAAKYNSNITLEMLMAANGMIAASECQEQIGRVNNFINNIDEEYEKYVPMKPRRGRKKKEVAVSEEQNKVLEEEAKKNLKEAVFGKKEEDDYLRFTDNLAFYLAERPLREGAQLFSLKKKIYERKEAVQKLEEYRNEKELEDYNRMTSIARFFKTGEGWPKEKTKNPVLNYILKEENYV